MSKQWCVYFIKESEAKNAPTKIGYTCDISKRFSTIQTYNSKEVKLDCTIPCDNKGHAQKLERFLHRQLYHRCHIRGEWFNLYNVHIAPILHKFYGSHKQMFPESKPLKLHTKGDLDYKGLLKENKKLKDVISNLEIEKIVDDSIIVTSLKSEVDSLNIYIEDLKDTIAMLQLK